MTSNILDKVLQPPKPSNFGGCLLVRYGRPVAVALLPAANLPVRGWSLAKRWKGIMASVQIRSMLTGHQIMSKALRGEGVLSQE